jgi:hypothetical protein
LLLCAALAVLQACGTSDNPSTATSSFNAKARKAAQLKAQQARSGQDSVANMVAAVSATKSGAPVELKFVLEQRPEVGQPIEVDVAIVPRAPAPDTLSAVFQVNEGLEIVAGAEATQVEKPAEGTPIHHQLKLVPKRDGIFQVTAVVNETTGQDSASRTFSIPIIAGQGLVELARPAATKGM